MPCSNSSKESWRDYINNNKVDFREKILLWAKNFML